MQKVSVIIPIHNSEKNVASSIRSVLEQTYTNFELILVDDGSTDNSIAICHSFTDSRIKLIRQEYRGFAGAKNSGIRNATGEFIAFLNAGDLWLPEKLYYHVMHLEDNEELGISYCSSALIDEKGEPAGVFQFPKLSGITFKDIICRNPIGNSSAAVIRRTVLDQACYTHYKNGKKELCYFDESFRHSEDIEYWLRIKCLTRWKFAGISTVLTLYRVNKGGVSANIKTQLNAWNKAIDKTAGRAPRLVNRWEPRATAYQLRYLARKAIINGNSATARKLIFSSLKSDHKILVEEPLKTVSTILCTLLISILPLSLYKSGEALTNRLLMSIRHKEVVNYISLRP